MLAFRLQEQGRRTLGVTEVSADGTLDDLRAAASTAAGFQIAGIRVVDFPAIGNHTQLPPASAQSSALSLRGDLNLSDRMTLEVCRMALLVTTAAAAAAAVSNSQSGSRQPSATAAAAATTATGP
jgi:hypothetical protein